MITITKDFSDALKWLVSNASPIYYADFEARTDTKVRNCLTLSPHNSEAYLVWHAFSEVDLDFMVHYLTTKEIRHF